MRNLLIIIFCLGSLPGQSQDSLSIDDIISIALENNFSIKIARNETRISRNNHSLGNAGFLPTVDVLANKGFTVEDTEQVFADGNEQVRDGARGNAFSWGGEVSWTVFNGGRMFFNYDRLKALQLVSEADLKFAIETLIYDIYNIFYQAALEQERLALFSSNLDFSEVRLRISKDRYELGRASKMEYLQAQVDYNADKSAIISQLEVLASRKYELLNLMGVTRDSVDFEIDYDLKVGSDLNLSDLLQSLELQSPQLISLKREVDAIQLDKKMLQAEQSPELDIYLGYNTIDAVMGAGFLASRYSNQITYGLTARWNVFNGFNLRRQIQNAEIETENTQLLFDQQLLSLSTQLQTTYLNYTNNISLMKLEEENLQVARENSEIAQERYRIGLSNPLELREAQINLVNAEIRFQNAAFAAKLAEIRLIYLSGTTILSD